MQGKYNKKKFRQAGTDAQDFNGEAVVGDHTKLRFSVIVVSWLTSAAWHFNDFILSKASVRSWSFWSAFVYATLQAQRIIASGCFAR